MDRQTPVHYMDLIGLAACVGPMGIAAKKKNFPPPPRLEIKGCPNQQLNVYADLCAALLDLPLTVCTRGGKQCLGPCSGTVGLFTARCCPNLSKAAKRGTWPRAWTMAVNFLKLCLT